MKIQSSRPRWSAAVAIVALVAALTACSTAEPEPEEAAPAGDGILHLTTGTGASGRAFEALVAEFTKQTGVEVDLRQVTADDVRQQQILDVSAQGGGDVLTLQEGWLAELAPFLVPLEPLAEEGGFDASHIVPEMQELFTYEGEVLAYPSRVAGRVLVYRTDLFEAAGIPAPPETFEELREYAELLNNPDENVYGFLAPLVQGNDLTQNTYFPMVYSFGGNLLSEDGTEVELNNATGQEATQFLIDLYQDGLMPPDSIEMGHDGVITAMQQGRAAMFLSYSPWFSQLTDPTLSPFADSVAVAPYLPTSADSGMSQGATLLGGWGFGINKFAKDPDLAQQFVEFATNADVQTMLAIEHGNDPVVSDVFEDPAYQAARPEAAQSSLAVKGGRSVPKVTVWTKAEDSIARAVTAALIGDQTVKEALDQAAREIEAELE